MSEEEKDKNQIKTNNNNIINDNIENIDKLDDKSKSSSRHNSQSNSKKSSKKVTQIIHLVILQDQSQIQKILFLEVDQTHILHLLILVHIVMKKGKKVKIPKFL